MIIKGRTLYLAEEDILPNGFIKNAGELCSRYFDTLFLPASQRDSDYKNTDWFKMLDSGCRGGIKVLFVSRSMETTQEILKKCEAAWANYKPKEKEYKSSATNILIRVDTANMMYRTFINGELYDTRDGFKNVEDIIGDAACTFLHDPDVDYSKGFRVEFVV